VAAPMAPDGAWIVSPQMPGRLDQLALDAGSVLEFAISDAPGNITGTGLVKVVAAAPPDGLGRFCEVVFGGASTPVGEIQFDLVLPGPWSGSPHAVLHLCRAGRDLCAATYNGQRQVCHIDTFRLRAAESVSEPWARTAVKPPVPAGVPVVVDGAPDEAELKEVKDKILALQAQMFSPRVPAELPERLAQAAADAARQHKKPSKKRRRRADSSSEDEDQLFRDGSARQNSSQIQAMAVAQPGRLYEQGLREIQRFLGCRVGPEAVGTAALMVSYLTAIFHGRYPPEKVGIRTSRELRTLAEALEALSRGDLPSLADLLMQRFKALEVSVQDGSWATAQRLELLPAKDVGLASAEEQRAAARSELLHLKLEEAKKKYEGKK
jgi:hypothetical protein